jgi:hypothetical protein
MEGTAEAWRRLWHPMRARELREIRGEAACAANIETAERRPVPKGDGRRMTNGRSAKRP